MKDKDKNIRAMKDTIEELRAWGYKNLKCADCDDTEFWRIINA